MLHTIRSSEAIQILNTCERGGGVFDRLWGELEESGYVYVMGWHTPDEVAQGIVKKCKHCRQWFEADSYVGCLADEAPPHGEDSFYKKHEAI